MARPESSRSALSVNINLFFYSVFLLLIIFLLFLYFSKAKWQYLVLHNLLKFIIVAGVFSILLIDIEALLERVF